MKTTIDIPEDELRDAIRFSGEDQEAIVAAPINRRRRTGALARHLVPVRPHDRRGAFVDLEDRLKIREAGRYPAGFTPPSRR
jgi:hypothetical protein